MRNLVRWSHPSPSNHKIPRAGEFHRSEIAEFYAQEYSTAQKLHKSTRGKRPALGKCRIPRAGTVHRSETAESRVLEQSIAQKLWNSTRGSRLLSINGRIKFKSTN